MLVIMTAVVSRGLVLCLDNSTSFFSGFIACRRSSNPAFPLSYVSISRFCSSSSYTPLRAHIFCGRSRSSSSFSHITPALAVGPDPQTNSSQSEDGQGDVDASEQLGIQRQRNKQKKELRPHGLRTKLNVQPSFVTEATDESLQYDTPETDGNGDQFQLSGLVDEVENVDDEMDEVLAEMTSSISLTGKLPVASNSVCVGIDPDLSGAIAVLKSQDNCTVAEVPFKKIHIVASFDLIFYHKLVRFYQLLVTNFQGREFSPHILDWIQVIDVPCITVAVNKKMRRRHDYQSIAAIVKELQAPQGARVRVLAKIPISKNLADCSYASSLAGSIAYVEQAMPFPKDGKQGWYITGYGYGVWLGILAAAGFTVIPVQARAWKTAMGICGKEFTKDDSRALASSMFPVLSAQLRRKRDHGRAEALLIAAFGKGMTVSNVASLDEPPSSNRIKSPSEPTSVTPILAANEPPF